MLHEQLVELEDDGVLLEQDKELGDVELELDGVLDEDSVDRLLREVDDSASDAELISSQTAVTHI